MPFYIDQLGRQVNIPKFPRRIVSTVPSQTELLYDLGLTDEVIGVTKFCVHPQQWFKTKTRIGGTKHLNFDAITALQPDLIIANKEENVKEQIRTLENYFPVWISDVRDLDTALQMMQDIGIITGREKKAELITAQIKTGFSNLEDKTQNYKLRAAYLIWKDPYMTVGGDTFIHDMLNRAGFDNIFGDLTRYPQIDIEQLTSLNAEVLFLASEPYPFKQKHVEELRQQLHPIKIVLADGEMFSWYGSRLLKAPDYFGQIRQQIQALSLF